MRVYLTGFMGSGKTSVGLTLSTALGYPFLDLDAEVERRAEATIREIFERQGEATFRRLEREVLDVALAEDDLVVATGGGTVTFEASLEVIRRSGYCVWLNPSFATIVRRIGSLGKQDRPLFRDEVQALALYRARLPAYQRADVRIDVGDEETPEEVAARVALWLGQQDCAI